MRNRNSSFKKIAAPSNDTKVCDKTPLLSSVISATLCQAFFAKSALTVGTSLLYCFR